MIEDLDEHGKFCCIANGVAGILNYQYYFIRSFFKKKVQFEKNETSIKFVFYNVF